MDSILKLAAEHEEKNIPAALCTIVETSGSVPRKAGTKMLVTSEGKIIGTIGGGTIEKMIIEKSKVIIQKSTTEIVNHSVFSPGSKVENGSMKIFVEAIIGKFPLWIFGGGHIAKTLAKFASDINFQVTIIDSREGIFEDFKFGNIEKSGLPALDFLEENQISLRHFIASISHTHNRDFEIIAKCLKSNPAYLGMIGSKKKIESAKQFLLEKYNIVPEKLEKIDWPMGINISCETPDEIAISILAKLIDVRNKIKT